MTDSSFNSGLDALVRGDLISGNDELTRFATDLYRKEQGVTIPTTLKSTIATNLGIATGGETAIPSPVARESAHPEREFARRPWFAAAAVVIALSLALTGILQWSLPSGKDGDGDRSGIFSPAVPTVSATPASSPEAPPADEVNWLVPVTADECPLDETVHVGELNQPLTDVELGKEWPPREDAPFALASQQVAKPVVTRQRQAISCQNTQATQKLPVQSERARYEQMNPMFADGPERDSLWLDRLNRSQEFSAWIENDLGLGVDDLIHPIAPNQDETGLIWEPDNAVQFGDGRVALIPGWLTESATNPPGVQGFVPVWIETDSGWKLDEELFFCIGDCGSYWAEREASLVPAATTVGTAVATPAASPLADCAVANMFEPDYEIDAAGPVNLRARPGIQSVDPIIALPVDSQVMYLCESEPTTDPEVDGIAEGQLWLKVRTERGEEGWIREVNLKPISETSTPSPSSTPSG